jgi:hypothetical protein
MLQVSYRPAYGPFFGSGGGESGTSTSRTSTLALGSSVNTRLSTVGIETAAGNGPPFAPITSVFVALNKP